MAKTVLILGASYGGLGVAHKLLKNTLPSEKDLKVIVVGKSSHMYWNMASVRAVLPGLISDEDMFRPIAPGFEKYPKGSAEFVVGTATGVDPAKKTVDVATDGSTRSISYDYLVLATGARSSDESMPWKALGSYQEDQKRLHDVAAQVKDAKTIVVVGGGATGVELAAELRFEYKDKKVILLSAGDKLLAGDSVGAAAERELVKMGVTVQKGVKSEGVETMADGSSQVSLSNGEKLIADLVLSTVGLVPNSDFLPAAWLTERKYAKVDANSNIEGIKDVWAIGDIVSEPRAGYVVTDATTPGVAKNVEAAIKGKAQSPVKALPFEILVCATGRSRGVGRMGFFPVPSIMAWFAKGRTLAVERMPALVNA